MNLYIKQKIFSLRDKYNVYDELGDPVYAVEGELFTWGAKIHLCDLMGNELYYIQQKLFKFLPEYEIYTGNQFCARIKKEFTFFTPRLNVQSSYGDFEITGSFMEMDFIIQRNGQVFGEIHKKWLSWADTYCLTVTNPEDAAFFTSLVIAIDNCMHNESNK
ncbi:LURP-one-related/scramblase family protein [Caproiciproducens faecalis]|uniref:LURP-one-related family protein n=1 Tax=Caproiciproducens faecalis TaxID=2820301 RepID=A0ABS7DRL8_9FIRM|nr:LURP-one-related family protein [Caproiciproducens faecalis]MBW7573937.1 LURP-one-related family protein [Caproiciproducens faecalis]